jgi:hypothetical protein
VAWGGRLVCVAMFAEASRPVVRAATGFHADEYWGKLRQKGYQVMRKLSPIQRAPTLSIPRL